MTATERMLVAGHIVLISDAPCKIGPTYGFDNILGVFHEYVSLVATRFEPYVHLDVATFGTKIGSLEPIGYAAFGGKNLKDILSSHAGPNLADLPQNFGDPLHSFIS